MKYMGNKEFWDIKFANRGDVLLPPEKSLVENINLFKKGNVLDLACGDGRNALFLLKKRFKVVGVDFSNKALNRLVSFVEQEKLKVEIQELDLSRVESIKGLGKYDNVVVNHYKLGEDQIRELKVHIVKDGILFISGFGEKHKTDFLISRKNLICEADLRCLEKDFVMIKKSERIDEIGHFVTYIYKKLCN